MYVMKIAPCKDPKIINCDCSLKSLQTLVGGSPHKLSLIHDYQRDFPNAVMLVNKDCKALALPRNPIANQIVSLEDDSILGTVLIVNTDNGKYIGFDDAEADALVEYMERDLNIEVEIEKKE